VSAVVVEPPVQCREGRRADQRGGRPSHDTAGDSGDQIEEPCKRSTLLKTKALDYLGVEAI
jgi:hypothetical protein